MAATVTCLRVAAYDSAAVDAAVDALLAACPAADSLGAHSRVLLKPNLLAKHAPEKAVTTHPTVVAACIRALQARGVRHITVADSSGGRYTPATMASIYEASGLAQVCRTLGAAMYTDCRAAMCPSKGELVQRFHLIEPVHQADFIINLPKLKTHVMTGMTCAVKNLFGTIPGLEKAELHMRFPQKEHFADMLVDLCQTVQPQLTIADAIVAMEGDGPAGGAPRALGLLLGSSDPYALDLAAAHIIGIDPMAVHYLAAAHRRGLCDARIQPTQLAGDVDAVVPVKDFRLPESYVGVDFSQKAPRALRWAVPGVERWLAPRPKVRHAACIGCGKCAEICPGHTIRVEKGKATIYPSGCIRCFCCHEMCPVKAIDVKRFALFRL
jgi:uncharacterized protein (DUF362 family)/Pyruvate/2-oxoacid:ferredoxin oxidoreductase delta subunit